MSEYSYARTIPVGWERLTERRDTRTFWNGVKAEAEALATDLTDLAAIAVIRDRHLAFEEWFLSLGRVARNTRTAVETEGAATITREVKVKYANGTDEQVLLDAVNTNGTEVHVIGTDIAVSINAAADADGATAREFTLSIVEAA